MIGIAVATTRRELNAGEAFLEIEARAIALTPILKGRFWSASCDVYGVKHNAGRGVRSISATCSTSLGAVSKLITMLDQSDQEGGL
jgi:hypothetical protein